MRRFISRRRVDGTSAREQNASQHRRFFVFVDRRLSANVRRRQTAKGQKTRAIG